MDVGMDPELTKWSVRSGPAIVLTGKGYKERYWLAFPPSTTSVIFPSTQPLLLLSCRCPPALFPEHKINTAGAVPPFESAVRPGFVPTRGGLLLLLCSTKKVTA